MTTLDARPAAVGDLITPTGILLGTWIPQTEPWYAARRAGIGSSDIPAIVGSSAYATPLHIWLDKRGELPPEDVGEAADWGRFLEPLIAEEFARREGFTVTEVGTIAHVEHPWRRANLDRLVHGCTARTDGRPVCGVEVKTRSGFLAGSWQRDVPDDVFAQTQWQLHTTGLDHMHVACLLGGQRLKTYLVRPENDVIDYIVVAATDLWEAVHSGVMPAVDPGALLIDLLDRLHPERAGKRVIDRATAARIRAAHRAASADRKADDSAVDAAKAEMVALLADAAYVVDADGNTLCSYKPDLRRSCDLELLEAKYPAVYADVVTRKPTAPILRWDKNL